MCHSQGYILKAGTKIINMIWTGRLGGLRFVRFCVSTEPPNRRGVTLTANASANSRFPRCIHQGWNITSYEALLPETLTDVTWVLINFGFLGERRI